VHAPRDACSDHLVVARELAQHAAHFLLPLHLRADQHEVENSEQDQQRQERKQRIGRRGGGGRGGGGVCRRNKRETHWNSMAPRRWLPGLKKTADYATRAAAMQMRGRIRRHCKAFAIIAGPAPRIPPTMQHLTVITTGGTIDKVYFDAKSDYQ